jgi:hypothetical protein
MDVTEHPSDVRVPYSVQTLNATTFTFKEATAGVFRWLDNQANFRRSPAFITEGAAKKEKEIGKSVRGQCSIL